MAMKPLANTVATDSATNVYLATTVHLSNDSTARTITIANTGLDTGDGQHGSYIGSQVSIRIPANGQLIVKKRPQDTITGAAACYATKVDTGAQ